MPKIKLKHLLIFFLVLFGLFLNNDICLSRISLEVDYPQLPAGGTITPTTPLPEYIKYMFSFGMSISFLAAFISLIVGGFFYVTSVGRPEKVKNARSYVLSGIFGLALLLTVYLIMTTINPQLRFLKVQDLSLTPGVYLVEGEERESLPRCSEKIPSYFDTIQYVCEQAGGQIIIVSFYSQQGCNGLISSVELDCGDTTSIPMSQLTSIGWTYKDFGVYIYRYQNCPLPSSFFNIRPLHSSIPDLGESKNDIRSIKIVNDPLDYLWYIAILYDKIDWRGKCLYINPHSACTSIDPFASSLSIYRYYADPSDTGDITFYRKAFFNENLPLDKRDEGIFKVEHSDLFPSGYYFVYLKNLKFGDGSGDCNIPIEEQNCIDWDLEGKCIQRECPTLAGDNITSIKINGDYFVILLYYDEGTGEWSFCQAFPAPADVNKDGPKQIKWEYVHREGTPPNAVLIFPVYKK